MAEKYQGVLFIGDPHLASRTPGFRKDDYAAAILEKLRWCLETAQRDRLLPVLLGDLFHWPRDNANWLLTELLGLFAGREVLSVVGNHDTTDRQLSGDDSLAVLAAAGRVRLIDRDGPWSGRIGGAQVTIAGVGWSDTIPTAFERPDGADLVIFVTHHNVGFAGVDEAWLKPHEIEGVDLVVNGHIHRRLEDAVRGRTVWLNPGNIARVQRADAVRSARPGALRLDISAEGWRAEFLEVPHAPFDEVFYPLADEEEIPLDGSAFIRGLEMLRGLKTAGGAGLREFIENNLDQFDQEVAGEIRSLAAEVCTDENG